MPPRRRRHQSPPPEQPSNNSTQTVEDIQVLDGGSQANVGQEFSSDFEATMDKSSKPKIQIYKGLGDKVTIENWLKRFEMLAQFYNWSEKVKIVMLGNYLEDDALNWYIENSNDSYVEMKVKLNTRFGIETVEPIVEFVNHRYDFKTGIKDYFETKRRYGVAAKLTESQIIPLMINNLPQKMSEHFTAVKPKTFAEFYSIAKTAENHFKRNSFKTQFSDKTKPKSDNTTDKPKRKPPNPCKICEDLGFKGRYHWMSDCKNKASKHNNTFNQTKAKTINSIENQEIPENDIRNIDLN